MGKNESSTPADRVAAASTDAYFAIALLDGCCAILAAHKRSKHARAALVVAVNAAGTISRASEMLDDAGMGNLLKFEAGAALPMLAEAEDGLAALQSIIESADEYGTAVQSPAFEGSDPFDSAARLAERARAEIGRLRRRAAAAIRDLPEPFKVAA